MFWCYRQTPGYNTEQQPQQIGSQKNPQRRPSRQWRGNGWSYQGYPQDMQKPTQENLEQASYSNQRYPQEMQNIEQQNLEQGSYSNQEMQKANQQNVEQDLEQDLYSTHAQVQEPTHWEPAGIENLPEAEEIDEKSLPNKIPSRDRNSSPYNGGREIVRPEKSAANIVPSRERFQVPPAVERSSPAPATSRNEQVSWN